MKTRNYQRLLAAGAIPLRADIGQLICDARTEDVRLGIASSSKHENIVGLLRANLGPNAGGLVRRHCFRRDRQGQAFARGLQEGAAELLNLPPRDCLVVEDSAHGLTASVAAGIPTVITQSDYTHDDDFEGARMVLHETEHLSLEELRLWHATASTS